MLKSNKHSSLYSLELGNVPKNDEMVKILTCPISVDAGYIHSKGIEELHVGHKP